MKEPARRIRMGPPEEPVPDPSIILGDLAQFERLGMETQGSFKVNRDPDGEWQTIEYTVSRRRRRRDS